MGEVEGVIRRTLHKLAAQALAAYAATERSKWILEWPGQLVLNCSQVCPVNTSHLALLPLHAASRTWSGPASCCSTALRNVQIQHCSFA